MKTLLVFCFCLATGWAAVVPWKSNIESEYRQEYQKYCLEDGVNEGETDGVSWECKRAETVERGLNHDHELTITRPENEQIIFIEIPVMHYDHTVNISGNATKNTKVYIIPATDKETVLVTDDKPEGDEESSFVVLRSSDSIKESVRPGRTSRVIISETGEGNKNVIESVIPAGTIKTFQSPKPKESKELSSTELSQLRDLLRKALNS